MAYLVKEKFNLTNLVPLPERSSKLVLIAEPEEYLRSLYSHYLASHNFQVVPCRLVPESASGQSAALGKYILEHNPDLVILNTGLFGHLATFVSMLAELRKKHRALPIVTIGYNLSGQELSELLGTGISSHIDRKLTKPMDIVHIVKVILNY